MKDLSYASLTFDNIEKAEDTLIASGYVKHTKGATSSLGIEYHSKDSFALLYEDVVDGKFKIQTFPDPSKKEFLEVGDKVVLLRRNKPVSIHTVIHEIGEGIVGTKTRDFYTKLDGLIANPNPKTTYFSSYELLTISRFNHFRKSKIASKIKQLDLTAKSISSLNAAYRMLK